MAGVIRNMAAIGALEESGGGGGGGESPFVIMTFDENGVSNLKPADVRAAFQNNKIIVSFDIPDIDSMYSQFYTVYSHSSFVPGETKYYLYHINADASQPSTLVADDEDSYFVETDW